MKKIYYIIFVITCIFCIGNVEAYTDKLNSIDINVYIDQTGNGQVTEVWNAERATGTEFYKSVGNLEGREITDFLVKDETGKTYQSETSWNVNMEREQKSGKSGIKYTNDGLELCWGIGEYGLHTYTLTYTITNLVWQYDNEQIMYYSFLPQNMNPTPADFKLTVYSDKDLSNVKYSSYGGKSNNVIKDGKVQFHSTTLTSNDYLVALIGFTNGTFTLSTVKQGTYDNVVDDALVGADLTKYEKEENNDEGLMIAIIMFFIVFIPIILFAALKKDKYIENWKLPKKKDIPYIRDIPFEKNLLLSYFIGNRKNLYNRDNLMGAILLKWLKEKRITMVSTEGGVLDFNKNDNYYLDLTNLGEFNSSIETELANHLLKAANDTQLTPKEMKKYCTIHYEAILNWTSEAYTYSRDLLIEKQYITETTEQTKNPKKVYILTEKLKEEYLKLFGLKKFLLDMSLIDEKKAIEVALWEEYLIFAQALGIASKVQKQFKDFKAVDYNQNANYYNSYFALNIISNHCMNAAHSAYSAAHSDASSGGSFSGGGMSSGGFSSGGGGFR